MLQADHEIPTRKGFALLDLIPVIRDAKDGALVALTLDDGGREDLERWSALTRHAIVERQIMHDSTTRLVVRKGAAWVEPAADERRLWVYSNFDCNLACDYCCVRSSPQADRRALEPGRVRSLARDAAAAGYDSVYITGGEPFVHNDIDQVILASAEHLPTTVLTNAMLFRGPRLAMLERLPRERVRLQVSLDSPTPRLHDAHRGEGAWARAVEGIHTARSLGFRVRIAATTTTQAQMRDMDAFLAKEGVPPEDRVIRPLALRGHSREGVALARRDLRPELTATASGWYWHPVGAADDDLRIAGPEASLAEASAELVSLMRADGAQDERLAKVFACA